MKLIIGGILGKMGEKLQECCKIDTSFQIVAGFDFLQKECVYPIFNPPFDCDLSADLVIDFSTPSTTELVLDFCFAKKIPILIATTGLSKNQLAKIKKLSSEIPILLTSNTSLGAFITENCSISIAKSLKEENIKHQIEIIETHHNQKKDVPSGTALSLANSINMVYNNQNGLLIGRNQGFSFPQNNEICIHSLRGGNVVGKHEVYFFLGDEVISITHQVYDKKVFAWGALSLAKKLIKHKNGLYSVQTV